MLRKPSGCHGCSLGVVGSGFMSPDGEGTNGVLLIGEALGAEEAEAGRPFVGAAGRVLNDCIARAGFNREDFRIANAMWCRPPRNDIAGPYAPAALKQCWIEHLYPLIKRHPPAVIMPLGNIALRQFIERANILDHRGYATVWQRHVLVPSVHPSYIMRGNPNYASVLIHDLQLAVRMAQEGFKRTQTHYVQDPNPNVAREWLRRELRDPTTPVAFDIETTDKGIDEDMVDWRADGRITRISFAARPHHAMSLKFNRLTKSVIREALASPNPKIVWNAAFDCPRLEVKGFEINGTVYDGMIAWHVLHSDLPKSLGFVASLLLDDQPRWKHLSRQTPAFYNAIDSDAALRITLKTWDLLKEMDMWKLYQEQIVDCEPVFQHMHRKGMPVDSVTRRKHAITLDEKLKAIDQQIQDIIPEALQKVKLYKSVSRARAAHHGEGSEVEAEVDVNHCPACGKEGRITEATHPCNVPLETRTVRTTQWAIPQPFIVSWQSIAKWQDYHKHKAVLRKGKRTTDETALRALILKHPDDPLYPLVLDYREVQKLSGTYIGRPAPFGKIEGGLPVYADGRCHPTITNNPDTMRTSMVNPNLQQIPHGGGLQGLVKDIFVAPKGSCFWEIDYSGIEALLVGYFARSPQLMRLSTMGVHDYVNAYALHFLDQKIPASALPELGWGDDELRAALKEFKQRFPRERFVRKRLVHGHHYMMGPFKAQEILLKELNRTVPLKDIKAFFKFYAELFPEISTWQKGLCLAVDGTTENNDPGLGITAGAGWVRNPSGMIHRYFNVLKWTRVSDDSWTWNYGPTAKALVAFNPQHAAAAIGRRAITGVRKHSPSAHESLRLFIHDSLVGECARADADDIINTVTNIMTQPIPWLPLPAEWNMGTHLSVGVEAQVGDRWGKMKTV